MSEIQVSNLHKRKVNIIRRFQDLGLVSDELTLLHINQNSMAKSQLAQFTQNAVEISGIDLIYGQLQLIGWVERGGQLNQTNILRDITPDQELRVSKLFQQKQFLFQNLYYRKGAAHGAMVTALAALVLSAGVVGFAGFRNRNKLEVCQTSSSITTARPIQSVRPTTLDGVVLPSFGTTFTRNSDNIYGMRNFHYSTILQSTQTVGLDCKPHMAEGTIRDLEQRIGGFYENNLGLLNDDLAAEFSDRGYANFGSANLSMVVNPKNGNLVGAQFDFQGTTLDVPVIADPNGLVRDWAEPIDITDQLNQSQSMLIDLQTRQLLSASR